MHEAFIHTLSAHRSQIRARWEGFLRVERVNTPLANPDTLVYLFDQTLDDIFAMLREPPPPDPAPVSLKHVSGKNPLIAYFVACEQALLEVLILAQVGSPALDPAERAADLAELKRVVRTISHRDIGTLEGVCRPRKTHPPAARPSLSVQRPA